MASSKEALSRTQMKIAAAGERGERRIGKMGEKGSDVRNWNEDDYRNSILQERDLNSRTVFAPSPHPDILVVASSDGSVAPFHIPSSSNGGKRRTGGDFFVAEPMCLLRGHNGPAYDVKFYGDGDENCLLFSCGDDGHIRSWRWKEVLDSVNLMDIQDTHLKPVIDLVNPQEKGPWGALSPTPENNAIATDPKETSAMWFLGGTRTTCIVLLSAK